MASQLRESELVWVLQKKPEFMLPCHEELLHSTALQNAELPLCFA